MRTQRILFLAVTVVLFVVLGARAWSLRFLYTNSDFRIEVRSAIEQIAEEEGWILSDIDVRSVESDSVTLDYRPHHRGTDASHCFVIHLSDTSLHLCDE